MSSVSRDSKALAALAARARADAVAMSHRAGSAHLASSLSCIDLLVAAYGGVMQIDPRDPLHPGRDRLILSKGHAVSALYAVLARLDFFPPEGLQNFNVDGGHLPEQPSPGCAPGVEWATGSLGHGLNVAIGMALAGKIQGLGYRTFAILSDGECNEGTTWEGAMFAPAHRLNRLTVAVDYNKWQATGRSEDILSLKPLAQKWEAFGWDTVEVDGHDMDALVREFSTIHPEKPRAIIAHTTKGKGVSFMEDDNNWHYRSPTADEVAQAEKELQAAIQSGK